jgi:hypothetical protein
MIGSTVFPVEISSLIFFGVTQSRFDTRRPVRYSNVNARRLPEFIYVFFAIAPITAWYASKSSASRGRFALMMFVRRCDGR